MLQQETIAQKANYQLLSFHNQQTKQTMKIHEVLLKANHYRAQLVDQKPWFRFLSFERVYQTTAEHHAFAGINGGYFTPENQPLGLMILKGKKTASFSYSKLLSGLVIINKAGKLSFRKQRQGYHQAYYALQAGPFLIKNGKQVTLKKGPASRRTVIALSQDNDLLLLSVNKSSLLTLSHLLENFPKAFLVKQIKTALNLDGGSSTSMTVFLPKQSAVVVPEILPVRNALIFYLT